MVTYSNHLNFPCWKPQLFLFFVFRTSPNTPGSDDQSGPADHHLLPQATRLVQGWWSSARPRGLVQWMMFTNEGIRKGVNTHDLHIVTRLRMITVHYLTVRCITLRCIALRYITLHYMTQHYITWHYITVHDIAWHYDTTLHTHIMRGELIMSSAHWQPVPSISQAS